jgi:hypothetical protein
VSPGPASPGPDVLPGLAAASATSFGLGSDGRPQPGSAPRRPRAGSGEPQWPGRDILADRQSATQGFDAQGFDAQQSASQRFGAQGFDAQGFDAQQSASQRFGAEGFGAQGFDAQRFESQQSASQRFDAQRFDAARPAGGQPGTSQVAAPVGGPMRAVRPTAAEWSAGPGPAGPAPAGAASAGQATAAQAATATQVASPSQAPARRAGRPAEAAPERRGGKSKQRLGRLAARQKASRRRVFKVYAISGAVAVIAGGALVLELLPSGGPAHQLVTPQRIGAYAQAPALAESMKAAALRSSIVSQSSGEASHVVAVVYQSSSSPVVPGAGGAAGASGPASAPAATCPAVRLARSSAAS